MTEKRWIQIEEQLQFLQRQVNNLAQRKNVTLSKGAGTKNQENHPQFRDIVIQMDPKNPSLAIKFLSQQIGQDKKVFYSTHVHCSVQNGSKIPMDFWPETKPNQKRHESDVGLTLIWKPVGLDPVLKLGSKNADILGEVNICRFLCRLFNNNLYESCPNLHWVDDQLDLLHSTLHNHSEIVTKSRPQNLKGVVTLADVCFASFVLGLKHLKKSAPLFVPVPEIKSS